MSETYVDNEEDMYCCCSSQVTNTRVKCTNHNTYTRRDILYKYRCISFKHLFHLQLLRHSYNFKTEEFQEPTEEHSSWMLIVDLRRSSSIRTCHKWDLKLCIEYWRLSIRLTPAVDTYWRVQSLLLS